MGEMTEQKLLHAMETMNVFKRFVRETSLTTGRQFILNAYTSRFCGNNYRPIVQMADRDINRTLQGIHDTLHAETEKFRRNKAHIDRLQARAIRGEFFRALNDIGNRHFPMQTSMDPASLRPSRYFPNRRSIDIHQGMMWVLGCSNTSIDRDAGYQYNQTDEEFQRMQAVAARTVLNNLRNVMLRVIHHRMNVVDVNTLTVIQRSAGPVANPDPYRYAGGIVLPEFYGGTAMGTHLQHYVANHARGIANSARSPLVWYDVAAFQLAGHIVAHGFTDANGRSARILYACTLIQKGLPFIAPASGWVQNQIHDRNVNEVFYSPAVQAERLEEAIMDII